MAFTVVDPDRSLGFNGMDGIAAVGELPARDDVALAGLREEQRRPGRHGALDGRMREVAAYFPAPIGEVR